MTIGLCMNKRSRKSEILLSFSREDIRNTPCGIGFTQYPLRLLTYIGETFMTDILAYTSIYIIGKFRKNFNKKTIILLQFQNKSLQGRMRSFQV